MFDQGITRREFIGRSVAGAATASLALGAPAIGRVASPNERVTVGIIGAGIRGLEQMLAVLAVKGNVAVVCEHRAGVMADSERRQHRTQSPELQPVGPAPAAR